MFLVMVLGCMINVFAVGVENEGYKYARTNVSAPNSSTLIFLLCKSITSSTNYDLRVGIVSPSQITEKNISLTVNGSSNQIQAIYYHKIGLYIVTAGVHLNYGNNSIGVSVRNTEGTTSNNMNICVSNATPATINLLSSTSSTSTSYNLRAGIKSSSKVTNITVSANNSRGINSVVNDGYDFILNRNLILNYGRNVINVSVTNSAGATVSEDFFVEVKGEPMPVVTTEKRIALVIGNSNYRNGISYLRNTINDANAMERKLQQCGFYVIKRTDLQTAAQIQNAINDFGATARNGNYDVAMFFYAGHGISYNTESWIVPTNANINCLQDIPKQCANAGWIMDATEGVKNRIVVFDACRNLPNFSNCGYTPRSIEDHINGITSFKRGNNAFVAYACGPGETSGDGYGNNGVYTEELLKVLDIPNKNILDVFSETASRVHNKTNGAQNPFNTSAFYSKFIFNRK